MVKLQFLLTCYQLWLKCTLQKVNFILYHDKLKQNKKLIHLPKGGYIRNQIRLCKFECDECVVNASLIKLNLNLNFAIILMGIITVGNQLQFICNFLRFVVLLLSCALISK